MTTTLMHADLIVAADFPDDVFLRDVDIDPGQMTSWTLNTTEGSPLERAIQMAQDAGWSVTEGSAWAAETTQFGDGQTIRIERWNTVQP
jgi:hypothetical protein